MKNNKEKFDNHYYVSEEGNIGDTEFRSDVEWSGVSEIPYDSYVITPAVPGNKFQKGEDAIFKRFTQCDRNYEYIVDEGEVGNSTTAGRDRRCDELTQCDYDIQYVSSDLITNSVGYRTNDNTCADILPENMKII